MPFGADWRDFPMNITLDSGWMWVLSHFTRSPPLIVNLQWLIAVGLAAALACYAFTRLAFKLAPSAAFGAIFALLPYTFFRGTRHLHCEDYAIPLIALSAIEIVRGTWTASVPRTGSFGTLRSIAKVPLYAWIGCLIAGLAYAYTAFFAVFVLMMAGVLSLLKNRDIRQIVLPAALAGVVVGVTVVDLSPSLIFWARNGQNAKMLFKIPRKLNCMPLKFVISSRLSRTIRFRCCGPLRHVSRLRSILCFQTRTNGDVLARSDPSVSCASWPLPFAWSLAVDGSNH